MTAPATIVCLAIEHRTSEDWFLRLPMRLGPAIDPDRPATVAENVATAAILAGAQLQLLLKGKNPSQQAVEILFNGPRCRAQDHFIVLEAEAEFFANKAGTYRGDLLVKLSNGFDFVSHEFELQVLASEGFRP